MHGLKGGVGGAVGLLLVSILGIWTVSQLQCHTCTDYRYMWHVAFPSTLALRWAGLHGSASCCLRHNTHLAGRQTPLFSISPDTCSFLLTLLCGLWGQFASESGICSCLSPRLPLLTMPGWKPCSGKLRGSCSVSHAGQQIQFPQQKVQTKSSNSSLSQVQPSVPYPFLFFRNLLVFSCIFSNRIKMHSRASTSPFSISFLHFLLPAIAELLFKVFL